MNHGTVTAYNYHCCRCEPCKAAHAADTRQRRRRAREAAPAPAPVVERERPQYATDLVNLRHAMTLEEWQAREAADPACRPVTQAPIKLRRPADADAEGPESVTDAMVRRLIA